MSLVTAVITTHKREPKIVERALKSILNQTHKDLEIIVVDDSPVTYELRDAVKGMVESYADKGVKYIQHETCKGACAARNTGLSNAKGEFIGFLDDDDEWLPEKIEKQLTGFVNENVALVYCGRETFYSKSNTVTKQTVEFHKGKVFDKLIFSNFIGSTSFPLLRKDFLNSINGFDVLMQSAQDYDVWLRLAEKYEINYVTDVLVRYYVHESEQISKSSKKRIAGLERLNEKNIEYLRKHRKAYWFRTIKLAPIYALDGNAKKAKKTWLKASKIKPFYIIENLRYLKRTLSYIKEQKIEHNNKFD